MTELAGPAQRGPGAASIVGVGSTDYSRRSGRSESRLAIEAVCAALADAGLDPKTVDGIVCYPDSPPAEDLIAGLGLPDVRFTATSHLGGASSVASLQLAGAAISAGVATTVVCVFARNGSSRSRIHDRIDRLVPGQRFRQNLERPHGISTPAQWYSFLCRRHMHEFGTTREHLGSVAMAMRSHAQLNPGAQMYGKELHLDTYLKSPPVALPYLLHDCCLETDGGCAVVLTRSDAARDCRAQPVRIAGVAEGHPSSPDDISGRTPFFDTGLRHAARRVFASTGIGPSDVDVAMIYDCFTFEVIHQLEEAGFCDPGEGGPFAESGAISLTGSLPVNPHGGLMGEGHLGGMNHVIEGVRQLRGECGERQVLGAEVVAVTGWGDLGDGSMAILVPHD
jgi:acetyl-CoA acetyltransferase